MDLSTNKLKQAISTFPDVASVVVVEGTGRGASAVAFTPVCAVL